MPLGEEDSTQGTEMRADPAFWGVLRQLLVSMTALYLSTVLQLTRKCCSGCAQSRQRSEHHGVTACIIGAQN